MKLLIVDDENLTRDGLIHSIDWESLGISQIFQADDGLNGYQVAQKEFPDIVLTDVRMPRMTGIEMCEKIHSFSPDCPIIFMSGYSDKEYLKAAIKLRAVRYVEKPINPQEISSAIQEAVWAVKERKLHTKSQVLFQQEASSHLALALTRSDFQMSSKDFSTEGILLPFHASSWFSTLIIKFEKYLSDFAGTDFSDLLNKLEVLCAKRNLHQLYTLKNTEFLILHLFGNERPDHRTIQRLCNEIQSLILMHERFFIVVGKSVQGPEKVYLSYNSAVILLQNAFFCPYGSILLFDDNGEQKPILKLHTFPDRFLQHLLDKNISSALAVAQELYQQLLYNRTILANQAKDIYYKMLSHIDSSIYQLRLSAAFSPQETESPMELVTKCHTLDELHSLLVEKTSAFDLLLSTAPTENSTIFLIQDYIGKHYMNDSLSIKDISEHVHLSSSYICTIFKTETGQTLNQYITDFRIEKAKQLLADPRNKITDISAKVGYADGNYFSKSFKKSVGLSPSEYRERELT